MEEIIGIKKIIIKNIQNFHFKSKFFSKYKLEQSIPTKYQLMHLRILWLLVNIK